MSQFQSSLNNTSRVRSVRQMRLLRLFQLKYVHSIKRSRMNFAAILAAILGEAEQIVPVFIHNPNSQKIEAVVVSTVNGVLSALGQIPKKA
jgi:hypothetical protein